MAYQKDISDVTITLGSLSSERGDFETTLFLTFGYNQGSLVGTYSSYESVVQVFGSESEAAKAAQVFFLQDPAPAKLKIAQAPAVSFIDLVELNDAEDYTVRILQTGGDPTDDNDYASVSFTPTIGNNLNDIANGLAAALEAAPAVGGNLTATANGTSIELSYSNSTPAMAKTDDSKVAIFDTYLDTVPAGDFIADLLEEDSSWFFFGLDHSVSTSNQYIRPADISGFVDAVTATGRMAFVPDTTPSFSIVDAGLLVESNGFYYNSLSNQNVVAIFSGEKSYGYLEMAYVASSSVYEAGSVAWTNYPLSGVALPKVVSTGKVPSDSEYQKLADNNINFLQSQGGVVVVREGKVTAGGTGEWIDTIRGKASLTDEIEGDVRDFLISQKGGKIPYTDAGTLLIKSVLETALVRFVNKDFLASYDITRVTVDDTPLVDKAGRVYNGLSFTATLAGAITATTITGVLVI